MAHMEPKGASHDLRFRLEGVCAFSVSIVHTAQGQSLPS